MRRVCRAGQGGSGRHDRTRLDGPDPPVAPNAIPQIRPHFPAEFYQLYAFSTQRRSGIPDVGTGSMPAPFIPYPRRAEDQLSTSVGTSFANGDEVQPAVLSAVGPTFGFAADQRTVPTRLDLARWVKFWRIPTSRVAVTSSGFACSGRGLVATTEDFGVRGGRHRIRSCLIGWRWNSRNADGAGRYDPMLVTSSTHRQQASRARPELSVQRIRRIASPAGTGSVTESEILRFLARR